MVEQFFQQFRAKGLKEEKSVKKYQQKIEGRGGGEGTLMDASVQFITGKHKRQHNTSFIMRMCLKQNEIPKWCVKEPTKTMSFTKRTQSTLCQLKMP